MTTLDTLRIAVVGRARDAVARNPPGFETLRRIEEGLLSATGGPVRG